MDQALYSSILEVVGFITTVALPLMGFLLWLKFAFLVAGPGGSLIRLSARMKLAILAVLVSPVVFGWLVATLLTSSPL